MTKFNLQKGDRIKARTPAVTDENPPYNRIGGHNTYDKSLVVKKTYDHGVSTNMGYIHNNNIISKDENI